MSSASRPRSDPPCSKRISLKTPSKRIRTAGSFRNVSRSRRNRRDLRPARAALQKSLLGCFEISCIEHTSGAGAVPAGAPD